MPITRIGGQAVIADTSSPPGMLAPYAGGSAPTGWLLCDGAAVSRSTYANLFAAIGTAYGAGNGSTTFNVPDLRGRTPVGRNGGSFPTLGGTGGAETVTLTAAQSGLPSHNHGASASSGGAGGHSHSGSTSSPSPATHAHGFSTPTFTYSGRGTGNQNTVVSVASTGSSTNTEGNHSHTFNTSSVSDHSHGVSVSVSSSSAANASQSHANMPPYVVVNWIIKE